MPYYFDQYQGQYGYPPEDYQQQSRNYQGQYANPQSQVQVNVPQRQPPSYNQVQPQYLSPQQQSVAYIPQQQPRQYAEYIAPPVDPPYAYSYSTNAQHMNQAFLYNQQYQQTYQPQPPQVDIPTARFSQEPYSSPVQQGVRVDIPPRQAPNGSHRSPYQQVPRADMPPIQNFQPGPVSVPRPQPTKIETPNRQSSQSSQQAVPQQRVSVNVPHRQHLSASQGSPLPTSNAKPVAPSPAYAPSQTSTPHRDVLKSSKANTPKQQSIPKSQPAPESNLLSTEYPTILLTLADEYVETAKQLVNRNKDYYKLISVALGCMEAALKNFKLPPLREAQLSLKYAQILYDETDNFDDAETILTKSVDLCERMKFIDLKYAMQLLLAKVLFRAKPKAAMKDLQGMIEDVQTYRHVAWEYAFRVQAVYFSMEASDHLSHHQIAQQLGAIQQLAKQNADYAIYAFASILEAILHLRIPGGDGIAQSKEALARARSLQLNPDVEKHPQMQYLMDTIDLIWGLDSNVEKEVMVQRRKNLRKSIAATDDSSWATDNFIWLRVNTSSLKGLPTQETGLVHERDGKHYIVLSWIGLSEMEAIGFLLHVASNRPFAAQDSKSEAWSDEGCLVLEENILNKKGLLSPQDETLKRQCRILSIHMRAEAALVHCTKGQYQKAQHAVKAISSNLQQLPAGSALELEALVTYLKGSIFQGTGDLDAAFKAFQSKHLALRPREIDASSTSKSHQQQTYSAHQLLRILAALNTALIIISPSHPHHKHREQLINVINSHMSNTAPAMLTAAYALICSTLPDKKMVETKQLLGLAMNKMKESINQQVQGLTLALMQDKFYRGGVQDSQAVKCARAASQQIKTRWGNPLWTAVSGEMEVESLRLQQNSSKNDYMEEKVQEVNRAWQAVPDKVKRTLQAS